MKVRKGLGTVFLALSLACAGAAQADWDEGWEGHHGKPMSTGGMMGAGPMAHHGMGGMGPMMMGPGDPFMAVWSVGLSPEQRKQIREIYKDWRAARFQTMEKMAELEDELWDLYQEPTPDPRAVGRVYGKSCDRKRQMIEKSVAARNEVWKLLNDRQRAMYQQRYWRWRWQQ